MDVCILKQLLNAHVTFALNEKCWQARRPPAALIGGSVSGTIVERDELNELYRTMNDCIESLENAAKFSLYAIAFNRN